MPNEFVFSGELDGLFIELGPTGADLQDSAGAQIHIDLESFPRLCSMLQLTYQANTGLGA
ncbi:hypothetical protein [Corynebacterium matruchotii]|jgi:hypothetical protein|uniref:hypothetical protein n=1 Tax=Corynebacterium matruchotii TaxID=43768 RepID=UPI00205985AE|nr:MAG TPA: hypothetical protein [Caudoviricetes sp.]DAR04260.1 MAG TPA: hypothetical protein [Caudoviricetes sp.]DAY41328.1 MAG TPA: hypothetical protein [Caudoviricetes sp.]